MTTGARSRPGKTLHQHGQDLPWRVPTTTCVGCGVRLREDAAISFLGLPWHECCLPHAAQVPC
jgi:hypothetical protein